MALEQPELRRLERVEVVGLFGIFDHRIDLNLADRVTLLHGPNGVGKTTVLKMLDALLTGKMEYFRRVPFERLALEFDDGAALELLELKKEAEAQAEFEIRLTTDDASESAPISLALPRAEAIAAEVDYLERDGDGWVDMRDGESLTDSEVVGRYSHRIRSPMPTTSSRQERDPKWFREFLGAVDSHFIEAQQLVQSRRISRWIRRPEPLVPRVVECSKELKRRIDDTMADYGRRAQTLDQSFPQRLLQQGSAGNGLSIDDIRSRMEDLNRKTEELKKIGILDEAPIHPFQLVDNMDDSQANVMTLYVDDTAQKLEVLEDLAGRARLLLKSLNGKFQHKQMRVNREAGLAVEGENGALPLDSLSSGEQHELILHYDLLFRVKKNTVVLLDEPELSLHIEWQSKFLSDLMEIVALSGFDAIVATHSPHIVGDRDDLMVELSG